MRPSSSGPRWAARPASWNNSSPAPCWSCWPARSRPSRPARAPTVRAGSPSASTSGRVTAGRPTRTRWTTADTARPMSLLPFLLVTGIGAIAALLLRRRERLSAAVGTVGLLVGVVAALLIRPDQAIAIGSSGIATTEYLRLFL